MTVVRIVVTVGAFALIARKVGFKSVFQAFAHSDPVWLAAGYLVAVVTIIITVWQWHGLAAANGVSRPYRRCLHLELAGDVFDAALPSSIGGDFIRATSLADTPEERVPSAAAVVLRRLCNFPGMIVLTAIGLLGTITLGYATRIRPYSLVVLVGGLVLVAMMLSPAMGFIGRWGILKKGPAVALSKLLGTLHEFRGRRRDLRVAMVRGLLFWAVVVASQSLFIRAVGVHIPVAYSALVITTATAVTMLPISLGGYGLREGRLRRVPGRRRPCHRRPGCRGGHLHHRPDPGPRGHRHPVLPDRPGQPSSPGRQPGRGPRRVAEATLEVA